MQNVLNLKCRYCCVWRDGVSFRKNRFLLPILQWRGQKTKLEKENIQRINELAIQMLSKPLYEHLFRGKLGSESQFYTETDVNKSIKHLKDKGLWGTAKNATLPDVNVKLPHVYGGDLDQHFKIIAAVQGQAYLELATDLCQSKFPPCPKKWSEKVGWTRYDPETGLGKSVECPTEDALILDVETCVTDSQRPILAVVLTKNAWYSWVSQRLLSRHALFEDEDASLDDLIPLEPAKSTEAAAREYRLIVGHHVGYDRGRVREQYRIDSLKTRFLDTLSLHVCVSGQANSQKGMWKAKNKAASDEHEDAIHGEHHSVGLGGMAKKKVYKTYDPSQTWMRVSCPNSLMDVHGFYVKESKRRVSKKLRDVFVKGSIQDIRDDFQNLMSYCANDVYATKEVLEKVLPCFLERCPHPVTFAGMLEMGSSYLPLNSSWRHYLDSSEYYYESIKREMKASLMDIAKDACRLMKDERYLSCPWLCNLDWETVNKKVSKSGKVNAVQRMKELEDYFEKEQNGEVDTMPLKSKFIICKLDKSSSSRKGHMNGYPNWYRALCMRRSEKNWRYGPVNITAMMRVTPYLLQMKWQGYPVHHHPKLGWGYIIAPDLKRRRTVESSERENPGSKDTKESLEELSNMLSNMKVGDEREDDFVMKVPFESKKNKRKQTWAQGMKRMPTTIASSGWKELGSEWGGACEEEDEEVVEEGVVEKGERKVVSTPWGLTDDVVTLPNKKTYYFFKLPHKYGLDKNVGNPLSKDFLSKMETGTLTSNAGQLGRDTLVFNTMISFWRSARARILNQFVVRTSGHFTDPDKEDFDTQYVINPPVQVAGTITRRAVESTWLTASNAKEGRVGSELKTLVRAPPGYHFVGSDVDSQELWIAALLGDQTFTKIQGGTAISWMILQGNKTDQTDVHSMTAKTIGISRDNAKVLNYGRIYGAGRLFIETLLRTFNPSFTEEDVKKKGRVIMLATKGRKGFSLNEEGQETAHEMNIGLDSCNVPSDEDWQFLIRLIGYHGALKLVDKTLWVDGTESHLFNKIESIAKADETKTPILGCHITRALENRQVGEDAFLTSRINWVVQSSAVDYLHLLLVCTRWLFEFYKIDGRYCLSIHDEVRYLVKSEDRYRAALALQYANLYTRAMFAYKLEMYDLPQSVAFFSTVDIDTVIRKDPINDCVTPSNPEGLEKGHGIPPGEALDIYDLIKMTNGSLERSRSS